MNMRQLLNDPEEFKTKFCCEATIRNLAGIDPDDLRKVLLAIYEIVGFNAANTPDKWTPEGSQQPVVTIGRMAGGGNGQIKMMNPRFGICTDAPAQSPRGATKLYLWVDHRLLTSLPKTRSPFNPNNISFNWRSGENGRADSAQKYYRVSEPLHSMTGGRKDIGHLHVEGGSRVVRLPDLLKELGELLKQPTKTAVQSAAIDARRLGLAQGCYTPASISLFNEAWTVSHKLGVIHVRQ